MGDSDIDAHDSVQYCDHALGPVWAHLWHDIVFVDIDGAALEINEYAATLIERWGEFEQPIYHGVPYLSLGLPFNCK